jgi:AraC-like DNA-binding protein
MAEYFTGSLKQIDIRPGPVCWKQPGPGGGNDIRFSSIREVDMTLDTTRFQICMPVRGAEPYRVDGKRYEVSPSEYFILNTYQHARAEAESREGIDGLCIYLTRSTLQEVADALGMPVVKKLDSPYELSWQQQDFIIKNYRLSENEFGRYLQSVKHWLTQPGNYSITDWPAFYYSLAEQFLRAHMKIGLQLQSIPAQHAATREEAYRRLAQAHAYLQENYGEPLSLDEISRAAHLSKYHLVRLYRQVYGQTPYQAVLRLRIEKAKQMLLEAYSPTEIAYRLSFSDRRAFSKVFKKFTGLPPSLYARAQRNY